MTKQQENRAFAKMLKEFPKAFGRVSFRERLMLRTAFTYVVEEVIADIKANCDLAIEGRDIKIKELEKENAELKKINSETLTQLNLDNGELIIENEKLRKENAGLKADRPQWHDLRKDPNDLPKGYAENTRFLCSVKGETLFLVRYGSFWQGNFEVDAWCEIPTFDKE